MDVLIGHVTHYYSHLAVAIIQLNGELKVGDCVTFIGHTTDFGQIACSMEVDHQKVMTAAPGTIVAIKVDEAVRQGDQVFKNLTGEENPENQLLWTAIEETYHQVSHTYVGLFDASEQKLGLPTHSIGLLFAALTFEPQATSVERLQVRVPYVSEVNYRRRLQQLAESKFLVEPVPGEYRLTSRGHKAVDRLIKSGREAMAKADPLAPAEGKLLAERLGQLVQACLFTPPPPETWSIRLSYSLMPELDPPLPYIEQAMSCLAAYRDDAHLAAWSPSGLRGPALEALTMIWRENASSLDEVYRLLIRRGYERHDYLTHLNTLRKAGLVDGADANLRLTSAGLVLRQQVEKDTDRYFYAPWSCLNSAQKAEVSCLLADLRNGLGVKAGNAHPQTNRKAQHA